MVYTGLQRQTFPPVFFTFFTSDQTVTFTFNITLKNKKNLSKKIYWTEIWVRIIRCSKIQNLLEISTTQVHQHKALEVIQRNLNQQSPPYNGHILESLNSQSLEATSLHRTTI